MLAITGLTAHYGAAQALFGCPSPSIRGETVALVGANGAGKTTLAEMHHGSDETDRRAVALDGTFVTGQSPTQMVRSGLALTPEGREVFRI
jgi:phenylacetate-CoA ligase